MRLAIINDYQNLAKGAADWDSLPDEVTVDVFGGKLTDKAEAIKVLQPYNIVVTAREETPFSADVVEALPNLKLLISHGVRNAALDMEALEKAGVTVCGTSYGYPNATVELTWAMILAHYKNLVGEVQAIRDGGWGAGLPHGLTNQTLGVVGLGRLGGGVARVGAALEMNIIAWSENLTQERCDEFGAKLVTKEELFSQADVISVHVVLSDRSRGLVGADDIARMKPTAFLLNTSRGPVVDEAALIKALAEKKIGGAGLDTFDVVPLPADHPFRKVENVICTAHIGGRTYENFAARYIDALDDVKAWLDGNPVRLFGK